MQTFRLNLSEMRSRKHKKQERDRETSRLSFIKLQEVHNKRNEDGMQRCKTEMQDYLKAQQTLQLMDSKFEKIKQYKQQRHESVKKSRNQYHTHVNEVKDHAHSLQETRVLLKMTHSLQRYSKVDTKRERANLNRQELSQYLANRVDEKLQKAEIGRRGVENHR